MVIEFYNIISTIYFIQSVQYIYIFQHYLSLYIFQPYIFIQSILFIIYFNYSFLVYFILINT